jgi:hypothetical protein
MIYMEKIPVIDGSLKTEICFDASLAEGIYLVKLILNDKAYCAGIIYQR